MPSPTLNDHRLVSLAMSLPFSPYNGVHEFFLSNLPSSYVTNDPIMNALFGVWLCVTGDWFALGIISPVGGTDIVSLTIESERSNGYKISHCQWDYHADSRDDPWLEVCPLFDGLLIFVFQSSDRCCLLSRKDASHDCYLSNRIR